MHYKIITYGFSFTKDQNLKSVFIKYLDLVHRRNLKIITIKCKTYLSVDLIYTSTSQKKLQITQLTKICKVFKLRLENATVAPTHQIAVLMMLKGYTKIPSLKEFLGDCQLHQVEAFFNTSEKRVIYSRLVQFFGEFCTLLDLSKCLRSVQDVFVFGISTGGFFEVDDFHSSSRYSQFKEFSEYSTSKSITCWSFSETNFIACTFTHEQVSCRCFSIKLAFAFKMKFKEANIRATRIRFCVRSKHNYKLIQELEDGECGSYQQTIQKLVHVAMQRYKKLKFSVSDYYFEIIADKFDPWFGRYNLLNNCEVGCQIFKNRSTSRKKKKPVIKTLDKTAFQNNYYEKIDESKKTDVISSYLDLDNPIFIEQMFIDDEISSEDEHDENVGKVDLNKKKFGKKSHIRSAEFSSRFGSKSGSGSTSESNSGPLNRTLRGMFKAENKRQMMARRYQSKAVLEVSYCGVSDETGRNETEIEMNNKSIKRKRNDLNRTRSEPTKNQLTKYSKNNFFKEAESIENKRIIQNLEVLEIE